MYFLYTADIGIDIRIRSDLFGLLLIQNVYTQFESFDDLDVRSGGCKPSCDLPVLTTLDIA